MRFPPYVSRPCIKHLTSLKLGLRISNMEIKMPALQVDNIVVKIKDNCEDQPQTILTPMSSIPVLLVP